MVYHPRPFYIEQFSDFAGFDVLESVVVAACSVIAADTLCFELGLDAGKVGQVTATSGGDRPVRNDSQQKAKH